MINYNLTYQHLSEGEDAHPAIKALYDLHAKTSKTLETIFKSKTGNEYSRAAKAAKVYQESEIAATKIIADANQAKADDQQRMAKDYLTVDSQMSLSDALAGVEYLSNLNYEDQIAAIEETPGLRAAIAKTSEQFGLGYIAQSGVDESFQEAQDRHFEEELQDARTMDESSADLEASFKSTLQEQFKLESQHNYDESAEVLAGQID